MRLESPRLPQGFLVSHKSGPATLVHIFALVDYMQVDRTPQMAKASLGSNSLQLCTLGLLLLGKSPEV